MKDIKKFAKKHLNIIIGVVILVFAIIAAIMIKNFFFPDDSKMIYGNRLEGRDKVKITEKKQKEIKDNIGEYSKKTTVRIAGRIIYVDVIVNDDVNQDKAHEIGGKVLEKLSDEEKAYYDVQFLINNEKDKDHFPMAGYKHHAKTAISWTKNR